MAKYKEKWPLPTNPVVIGYVDTETGDYIPNAPGNKDYQKVKAWLAQGNIADPAYTPAEIAEFESSQGKQDDINSARQTYALGDMSVAEREAWIDAQLQGVNNLPQFIEATDDTLKKMIVYI